MYPRILAEECRLFLARFLKKKKSFQQMIADVDLAFLIKKHEFKTTTERKNLQVKKLRRRKKEKRKRAASTGEGGDT